MLCQSRPPRRHFFCKACKSFKLATPARSLELHLWHFLAKILVKARYWGPASMPSFAISVHRICVARFENLANTSSILCCEVFSQPAVATNQPFEKSPRTSSASVIRSAPCFRRIFSTISGFCTHRLPITTRETPVSSNSSTSSADRIPPPVLYF